MIDSALGEGVNPVYKAAYIKASVNDAGQIVFNISGNAGNANFISYDEVVALEKGGENAWYLNRGEAIAFTYSLKVDKTYANTDDFAVNRIHMNFNDPFGAGIKRYQFTGEGDGVVSARSGSVAPNDGGCYDYDGNRGLMSWVEVERGEIIPGIKKRVVSYVSGGVTRSVSSGGLVENASSILWEVQEKNQGSQEINAYVLTDTVQLPFQPMGKVTYRIFDSNNRERVAAYSNTSTPAAYLFEITHISDSAVTVLDLKGREHTIRYQITDSTGAVRQTGDTATITLPYVRYVYANSGVEFKEDETFTLSFSKSYTNATNTQGTVTMQLAFRDGVMNVLPAGYGTLQVSTAPIGNYGSGQYINRADFDPDRDFISAGDGLNMIDYVRDAASVTVNSSGSTSSLKRVTENQHTENTGNSNPGEDETNTISLADASNDFTYTLEVVNSTGQDMTRLVLVDNLPRQGDHYTLQIGAERKSAFNVIFADDPDVRVYVDDVEIDASKYTVQYSGKDVFDENDLAGELTSDWTSDSENARSIRVVITETIPANALTKATFKAKVAGERETTPADASGVYLLRDIEWIKANQGKIAYNSFAYWYQVASYSLSAGTELVGVRLPVFPSLTKRVLNRADEVVTDDQQVFSFVVYEGERKNSLPAGAVDFEGATVGVPRMITVDGDKYLQICLRADQTSGDLYQHEFWQNGERYTIQELEEDGYIQLTWSARNTQSGDTGLAGYYTFTFNDASLQQFTARNRNDRWALNIIKADAADSSNVLAGARFALFGRDPAKKMTGSTVPDDYVDANNITWYCYEIRQTNGDGIAEFDDLTEDLYRYMEVDPPMGYQRLAPLYDTVGPVSGGTVNTKVVLTVQDPPLDPTSLNIPVKKTLVGRDMRQNEFTFIMSPISTKGVVSALNAQSITNPASGEDIPVLFNFTLDYTHVDYLNAPYRDLNGNAVFYYVVYEEIGSIPGIAYDQQQYVVKVTLSSVNNGLSAAARCYRYGGSGDLPAEAVSDLQLQAFVREAVPMLRAELRPTRGW